MFNVYFNARFGGTPGKLAVEIRITRPDGSPIGWIEAWKRSAVDIAFALISSGITIWALIHVDPGEYSSMGLIERSWLLHSYKPSWNITVNRLSEVWIWSEIIVLLFNRRKRALHDFIAGTVVIQKEFAGFATDVTTSPKTAKLGLKAEEII